MGATGKRALHVLTQGRRGGGGSASRGESPRDGRETEEDGDGEELPQQALLLAD